MDTESKATFVPISYKYSQRPEDDSSATGFYSHDTSLSMFNDHVQSISQEGWSLISVQSIPRIEYNDHAAYSVPSGYIFFWQRQGEQGVSKSTENQNIIATPTPAMPSLEIAIPHSAPSSVANQAKAQKTPVQTSKQNKTGTDLNKKYRIKKNTNVVPAPVDSGLTQVPSNNLQQAAAPTPPTPVLSQSSPSVNYKPGPDDVSDFDPDDPLVSELREINFRVKTHGYAVDPTAKENHAIDDPEEF